MRNQSDVQVFRENCGEEAEKMLCQEEQSAYLAPGSLRVSTLPQGASA